jgi:hypothetical protein
VILWLVVGHGSCTSIHGPCIQLESAKLAKIACKLLVTDTVRWQVLPPFIVECAEELAVEVLQPPCNLLASLSRSRNVVVILGFLTRINGLRLVFRNKTGLCHGAKF